MLFSLEKEEDVFFFFQTKEAAPSKVYFSFFHHLFCFFHPEGFSVHIYNEGTMC
jgi:hypothetical protein